MITISKDELSVNGYSHIVFQDNDIVVLAIKDGGNDTFAIRESYPGWCLDTEDGRVLEFCSSG